MYKKVIGLGAVMFAASSILVACGSDKKDKLEETEVVTEDQTEAEVSEIETNENGDMNEHEVEVDIKVEEDSTDFDYPPEDEPIVQENE